MDKLQLKILKGLIDSGQYDIYLTIGNSEHKQKVTSLKYKNDGRSGDLVTDYLVYNPYQVGVKHISIYTKPKELRFFSGSGKPNTLTYEGTDWLCTPFEDIKPGDIALDIKTLRETYLVLGTFIHEGFEMVNVHKDLINQRMIHKEDVVIIRPIYLKK